MPPSSWKSRCDRLAEELRQACAETLAVADIRTDDRTQTMLAQEIDPMVIPYAPIGLILRYRVRQRCRHALFGWKRLSVPYWKTVATFGMEEMWDSKFHSSAKGIWCAVFDDRLASVMRPIVTRFATEHALPLTFAPR